MVKRIKQKGAVRPTLRESTDKVSFGFGGLHDNSFVNAVRDGGFFIDFINRLKSLCNIGWSGINTSWRHGYGFEKLSKSAMNKHIASLLPSGVDSLQVFRATGDNHVFLGYRDGNIFQILFIEYEFGDIYKHGKH